MHSLDDIATVVEHAPYVFRVDGAREVWIAEMPVVTRAGYFLQEQEQQAHSTT